MKLLEWNYKISQTESFWWLFFQAFQGRRHLNNFCFLFQEGGILPEGPGCLCSGKSIPWGFPLDMGRMERDGETPAWQSWTFRRPPSWARNDFTDPTFPSAPGYKAPDQTARVEFLIFPLGSFPPGPNATAGPWECRRTEPQEAAGAADFPRVVFVGSPGSWAREIHG